MRLAWPKAGTVRVGDSGGKPLVGLRGLSVPRLQRVSKDL